MNVRTNPMPRTKQQPEEDIQETDDAVVESRERKPRRKKEEKWHDGIHPDIKRVVWVVLLVGLTVVLILAPADQAGPWGTAFYVAFEKLFGWGYYLFPAVSFLIALSLFAREGRRLMGITLGAAALFVISGLGFMDIVAPTSGGLTGSAIGSLKHPFGTPAALVITFVALTVSFLVTLNRPVTLPRFTLKKKGGVTIRETTAPAPEQPLAPKEEVAPQKEGKKELTATAPDDDPIVPAPQKRIRNYTPPPYSLLASMVEKPTSGDLRANANVIERTLESFGVPVEMGEINVGPTVTRYTLKPAEGVKLARITALNQDLALALAAHPIRIEAPIPGKSLVGIEVPNKMAAVVRLGSLVLYPEFQKAEPLTFALGRNVNGDPIFADIARMPHLLVAGATGSGKSITIHDILISLLYKNSPDMLKLILIDPKRVELSIYAGLPHLIAPVVTENKKAMGALRWLIKEMENRYQELLEAGARDIKSYNKNAPDKMSYIVVVIDELADLMATYGREVEGSIIRLAQMARATGIHIVVSTQRPSVEVITGLIKANITTRIALQVASQIDSRTILDSAGAEKLLGNGDLLFVSAEKSKPTRMQGAYITEDEIKSVARFIVEHNQPSEEEIALEPEEGNGITIPGTTPSFDDLGNDDDDDELYTAALEVVTQAKKASASLLQRRLKVGYARAARMLDMMEERGIIGPGDGAKPREVLIEEDAL